MERLICFVVGYVFGLFPTGKLVSGAKGVDLTKHGSGNTGATNTMRVLGKKSGALVLFGDCMKAFIPCMIMRYILGASNPDVTLLYVVYAGLGAVVGHDYPVTTKFKGGKGIASSLGFILAVLDWHLLLPVAVVFLGIFFTTNYVSLSSITSCVVLFVTWTGLNAYEVLKLGADYRMESCLMVFVIMLLGVVRHKTNIVRLLSGTESKIKL